MSGADFATTWSGKPGRKYQSKKEQLKQRLSVTAHDIYQKYFKEAEHGTYGAMGKLREISQGLNEASQETEVSMHTPLVLKRADAWHFMRNF